MTNEPLTRAAEVWAKMRQDPNMLPAITVGQLDDLLTGAISLLDDPVIKNQIPIIVWREMSKLDFTDFDAVLEVSKEFLKLDAIRKTLDKLVEELP